MINQSNYETPSIWGVLFLVWVAITMTNCAQIAQPPGGKKDTLAPVLIDSYPKMKALNVKPKQIELFFNEYISADNLPQKTIITPGSGITFNYKVKPTSVILVFNEPLKDSTTYTMSFTDGIKDASEKNPATNLKLVFSTGNTLDSLNISGQVSNVTSGTTVEGALIGLYYPRDTLNAQTVKPIYYTKTDTIGRYKIENIKAGTYDVVAFTDRNNNFLFNPGGEEVGFLKERVRLNSNLTNSDIQLFEQNTTPIRIQRTESRSDSYLVSLSKGARQYNAQFMTAVDSLPSLLLSPTQLKFFRTKETKDTLTVKINVEDSLGKTFALKQLISFRQRSKRERPEDFALTTNPTTNTDILPNFTLSLAFTKPIGKVDPRKIAFSVDSIATTYLTDYTHLLTTNKAELRAEIVTKAKKFVRIQLEKGAITSILGDSVSKTQLTYPILDPEEYGVLRGRVSTKAKNYLLELIDERKKVVSQLKNVVAYEFKNVKPGRYRLRLIIDENNNGRWDTGRYEYKIPAEPIQYYPGTLLIKQNFELEDNNLSY